jgi:hypothetical protein
MMRADADAGALRAAPRRAGWTMFVRGLWLLLIWLAMPATAGAQATWTGGASLATYFFPDDDDVLQPTAFGDRGALHLEVRYNYEDVRSTSVFGGWNLEFGSTVKLMLTPMAGFVAGQTDGGIAGVKVNLAWRRLEAYTEGEFVVPGDGQNRFLYNWSEFSVWTTDWLQPASSRSGHARFGDFASRETSSRACSSAWPDRSSRGRSISSIPGRTTSTSSRRSA